VTNPEPVILTLAVLLAVIAIVQGFGVARSARAAAESAEAAKRMSLEAAAQSEKFDRTVSLAENTARSVDSRLKASANEQFEQFRAAVRASEEASHTSVQAQLLDCEKALAAAERSARAAEEAAALGREQFRLAELGLRVSQRPWVFVNPVDIEIRGKTKGQNPAVFSFYVENGGSSPALDVRLYFHCTQAIVLKFEPESIKPDKEKKSMIGPKSKIRASLKYDGEEESSLSTFFFYGYARYTDVFDQSHETLWCYKYNPVMGVFEPHTKYNSIA
jgi:hypothetical protein